MRNSLPKSLFEQKSQIVSEISKKILDAKTFVVFEYKGLTVAEISKLKTKFIEKNTEMKVYKNTALKIALQNNNFADLIPFLQGQNAVFFDYSGEGLQGNKELFEFVKSHSEIQVKAGYFDGKLLTHNQLSDIANIPGFEGLLSMLLSCLQFPVRSFAIAVNQIAQNKQN